MHLVSGDLVIFAGNSADAVSRFDHSIICEKNIFEILVWFALDCVDFAKKYGIYKNVR